MAEDSPSAPELPAEPANGRLNQVAALNAIGGASQTETVRDTVLSEVLLLAPNSHLGREVVVTGSVVWLQWRYRLQSDRGQASMVIDVKGLGTDDQENLRKAVDGAGPLGRVRARIMGTIERHGLASYRLAASDLVLTE